MEAERKKFHTKGYTIDKSYLQTFLYMQEVVKLIC